MKRMRALIAVATQSADRSPKCDAPNDDRLIDDSTVSIREGATKHNLHLESLQHKFVFVQNVFEQKSPLAP